MCYATEIATKLRHYFQTLNESQIWGSIELDICGYDTHSCRHLVLETSEAKIFARAEALSRGVPLPTNPEFIYKGKQVPGWFLFKRIN